MGRTLGFGLAVLGLGAIFLSLKGVKASFSASLPFLAEIPSFVLIIIGFVLLGAALFIMRGQPMGKQAPEVPIYEGKKIVGYRRVGRR